MNSWIVWLSTAFGVFGITYALTSSEKPPTVPKWQYESTVADFEQRIYELETQLDEVQTRFVQQHGQLVLRVDDLQIASNEFHEVFNKAFAHGASSMLELEKFTLVLAKSLEFFHEDSNTSFHRNLVTVVNALDSLYMKDRTFLTGKETVGINQFMDEHTD